MILLEHEIDGLLKRKIHFTSADNQNGTRFLDYTVMLNDKENEIVGLNKKIENLHNKLHLQGKKESDLKK